MRGATEHERLLAALYPRLAHARLADLTPKDADFLAGEIGAAAELVGFTVLSARRGRETGLPDAVFYAWTRQGMPTELSALWMQSTDALRAAVETAVAAAAVPAQLNDELDAVLDCLRALLADVAMPDGDTGAGRRVDQLLRYALPGEGREAFLRLLKEYGRPVAGFWRVLRERRILVATELDRLHETMQLGVLTGNHIPLLERLADGPQISSPSDTAELALSDWKRLIGGEGGDGGVGAPDDVWGETDEERERIYAQAIARSVERAFPTAVLHARIVKSSIPGKADLARFLENNSNFQIVSMDIDAYIERRGEGAFEDIKQPAEMITSLRALQRIHLLTPFWEQTAALLKSGFNSASAVIAFEEDAFADAYGAQLGGADLARLIHRRTMRLIRSCSGAQTD